MIEYRVYSSRDGKRAGVCENVASEQALAPEAGDYPDPSFTLDFAIEPSNDSSLDSSLDKVVELYRASTLGERRPVDDRERMRQMFIHANLVVTAWDGAQLVGIARSLTDFTYITYLSDLAVRVSHQRQGIGRELVRRTQIACGPKGRVLLLAAPAAEKYYARIGFEQKPQAWWIGNRDPLK